MAVTRPWNPPPKDATKMAFVGYPFLDPFLDSCLTDFGPHSGSQNSPTWHINRCQDAFPVRPHFGIDFLLIWDPKIHLPSTPVNPIML